jgi:hypothetical protein
MQLTALPATLDEQTGVRKEIQYRHEHVDRFSFDVCGFTFDDSGSRKPLRQSAI